nr:MULTISPECIES: helix-turn-helix transcriptional regulator [unclassified Leptolyngbya]
MEALTQSKQPRQKQLGGNSATEKLTGSEVKTARKARKWTQAKLAGTIDVDQSLIAKIESSKRPITPELETALRRVLEL